MIFFFFSSFAFVIGFSDLTKFSWDNNGESEHPRCKLFDFNVSQFCKPWHRWHVDGFISLACAPFVLVTMSKLKLNSFYIAFALKKSSASSCLSSKSGSEQSTSLSPLHSLIFYIEFFLCLLNFVYFRLHA